MHRTLSDTLKSSFSSSDIIARFGEDEFLVFLSNEQVNKKQIMQKTGNFYQVLSHRISSQKALPDFSVSIGIAYKNSYKNFSKLYKEADKALYQAKEQGKNCVVFYSENLYTHNRKL